MKVSVEKLPSSEALVEFDFSWDEVEKASDKAYRKLVQKVDIHGFRRGKAPRSLVERKLGKEYIYQEGLDDLMSEAYRDALKEHELTHRQQLFMYLRLNGVVPPTTRRRQAKAKA